MRNALKVKLQRRQRLARAPATKVRIGPKRRAVRKATMKAVRIHSFGGPETLIFESAPRPVPGKGEVLIRVHAAGVNPLDVKVRDGITEAWVKHTLPLVPGWDVSGEVESRGEGVTQFVRGDEVFGRIDFSRDGAYAEYTVARASELAKKPESLDPLRAAAIPIAGLTAWQALFDVAGLTTGRKILIHRAAGGVGTFAVQLARWAGATVIGTASGRNVEFVKNLGADEVVDYEKTRFEDVVRDADVVLDTLGGEVQDRSWGVLKKGGILVSIVSAPSERDAASFGVRATRMMVHPDPEQLAELAKRVVSGSLDVVIDHIFPLSEARRAHEMIQAGHVRGKLVLRID